MSNHYTMRVLNLGSTTAHILLFSWERHFNLAQIFLIQGYEIQNAESKLPCPEAIVILTVN